MRTPQYTNSWSTRDEIRFIKNLGSHRLTCKVKKEKLLENYLKTLKHRQFDDSINVKRLRNIARATLHSIRIANGKADFIRA